MKDPKVIPLAPFDEPNNLSRLLWAIYEGKPFVPHSHISPTQPPSYQMAEFVAYAQLTFESILAQGNVPESQVLRWMREIDIPREKYASWEATVGGHEGVRRALYGYVFPSQASTLFFYYNLPWPDPLEVEEWVVGLRSIPQLPDIPPGILRYLFLLGRPLNYPETPTTAGGEQMVPPDGSLHHLRSTPRGPYGTPEDLRGASRVHGVAGRESYSGVESPLLVPHSPLQKGHLERGPQGQMEFLVDESRNPEWVGAGESVCR